MTAGEFAGDIPQFSPEQEDLMRESGLVVGEMYSFFDNKPPRSREHNWMELWDYDNGFRHCHVQLGEGNFGVTLWGDGFMDTTSLREALGDPRYDLSRVPAAILDHPFEWIGFIDSGSDDSTVQYHIFRDKQTDRTVILNCESDLTEELMDTPEYLLGSAAVATARDNPDMDPIDSEAAALEITMVRFDFKPHEVQDKKAVDQIRHDLATASKLPCTCRPTESDEW